MTPFRSLRLIAVLTAFACASSALTQDAPRPTPAGSQAWTADEIAAVARMVHTEGVPVDVVTTMPGPLAQRVLLSMLNDSRQQRAWPNVVAMLGLVGDKSAGRGLMLFVDRAEAGPLTSTQARAKSGAIVGLGYLVQRTGDVDALNFLIRGVRPTAWGGGRLKWTSAATPGEPQKERLFATLSIIGLGVTGKPEARAVLQQIVAGAPPFNDVRAQVPGAEVTASEAVANNDVVRSGGTNGLLRLYRVETRPNLEVLRPGAIETVDRPRRRATTLGRIDIVPLPAQPGQVVTPPTTGRGGCRPINDGPICPLGAPPPG
jgi:hypothetical protein